jgi:hypothetical protein
MENFHAGWRSRRCASSARTARTDSSLKLGYASTISAMLMPAARDSRISATEMRVPRTRGLPHAGKSLLRVSRKLLRVSSSSRITALQVPSNPRLRGRCQNLLLIVIIVVPPQRPQCMLEDEGADLISLFYSISNCRTKMNSGIDPRLTVL